MVSAPPSPGLRGFDFFGIQHVIGFSAFSSFHLSSHTNTPKFPFDLNAIRALLLSANEEKENNKSVAINTHVQYT